MYASFTALAPAPASAGSPSAAAQTTPSADQRRQARVRETARQARPLQVEVASIVERMQAAGRNWESALDAHTLAPPDAGFPARLSALSEAAAEQAAAFELGAQGGLGWRSRSIEGEFRLAPKLTPGMTRPGRQELWDRFDGAVAGLAAALSGSSLDELAAAFSELADVSRTFASELRRSWRPARVG